MIANLLIQFKGNCVRNRAIPVKKKGKKFQEFYMIIKKEKES